MADPTRDASKDTGAAEVELGSSGDVKLYNGKAEAAQSMRNTALTAEELEKETIFVLGFAELDLDQLP